MTRSLFFFDIFLFFNGDDSDDDDDDDSSRAFIADTILYVMISLPGNDSGLSNFLRHDDSKYAEPTLPMMMIITITIVMMKVMMAMIIRWH